MTFTVEDPITIPSSYNRLPRYRRERCKQFDVDGGRKEQGSQRYRHAFTWSLPVRQQDKTSQRDDPDFGPNPRATIRQTYEPSAKSYYVGPIPALHMAHHCKEDKERISGDDHGSDDDHDDRLTCLMASLHPKLVPNVHFRVASA
jgi:hypothetical protein